MSGLNLANISKSFGAVGVLKGVNAHFNTGEVTAIVGDNGAGKSTLLKLMAGSYRPDSGLLTLDDEKLSELTPLAHRARGIEMVYQDLALARQQDVITNLYLGREKTGNGFLKRKAMCEAADVELQRLGIKISDLKRPVGLLSGGEQQAIAIARAALFNPRVLLLDEPTAALAVREIEHVLDLIRQQKARGRVVILVSHRLHDVFAVADRILVMKQGSLVSNVRAQETSLAQIVEQIVQ